MTWGDVVEDKVSGMKPNSLQSLSPLNFIKAAQAAHPAFKYAMVVAGLAAIVAVVIRFGVSPATLVFGIIILVVLMILFLVFAQAATVTTANLTLPSLVLIWSFLLLAIATAVLLFTSAFFDMPLPLKRAISNAKILPAAQDEGAHQSPDVTLRFSIRSRQR